MQFEQIEKKYGNFYAPNYMILVEGQDLLRQGMEIFGVQVNNQLNGSDTFSFKVNNPFDEGKTTFPILKRGHLLEVGKKIQIKVGYGDRSKLTIIFDGTITSVEVSYAANGVSQLDISGHDRSHQMMKGKRSENYGSVDEPIKYSEIVTQLAGKYGLGTGLIVDSMEKHRQIKQFQMSDFEFIVKKLAHEISFEAFVQVQDFIFRPRANDEQEVITTMEWGGGLVSFTPKVNTAQQVSSVEVRGWDPAIQEAIIGTAQGGDEQGREGGASSGAELVTASEGEQVLNVWKPVSTQKEADDLAKSILNRTAERLVTGNGVSIGIPDILPGKNISLVGLGELFSTTYYIQKCTHTIDGSGYKTKFSVKETTI